VFEQAGVNYSIVHGDDMPASATALRPELALGKTDSKNINRLLQMMDENGHIDKQTILEQILYICKILI
jgi:coproporphyrinogen III oxidase